MCRVEVRSQYYPEQSNPLKDQYIFVYKVKITNQSPQTVQLVSRTWEIKAIEATEVCVRATIRLGSVLSVFFVSARFRLGSANHTDV